MLINKGGDNNKLDTERHPLVIWGKAAVSVSHSVKTILKSFDIIIEEIRVKFLAWWDDLEEFQKYFDDHQFLEKLNDYIFQRFWKIAEHNSLDSYNEIYFFLYLFSLRVGENLFDNGDIYNEKNFTGLFEKYLLKIKSFEDLNTPQATVEIQSFARLCGVLNLICILSQNNNLKREFIFSLVEFVWERIQELLTYLESKWYADKKVKNSLEYILWLFPLNFSYIKYVQFDKEKTTWLDDFLKECKEMFDFTLAWYEKCREAEFSNDPKRWPIIKKVLLTNLTYIVSLIILKLDNKVNQQDCFQHPIFIEIKAKFWEYIFEIYQSDTFKYKTFDDIRNICNFIFIKNYKNHHTVKFAQKRQWLMDLFKEIPDNTPITQVEDLEPIHHLILFNTSIPRDILFQLLEVFCRQPNASNINFEVIRLKILNILLTRLALANQEKLKVFLEDLLSYVDKHKISSHLLYVYSLMYVTIGYCYSFFSDEESQDQAFENYAKFTQINYGDFDFQRYGIDIWRYYYNVWRWIADRYGLTWFTSDNDETDRQHLREEEEYESFTTEFWNVNRLWKWQLDDYSQMYTEKTVHSLLNDLDTFLSTQKDQVLNLSDLSTQVSRILSNIFHGVAEIEIIDKYSGKKFENPKHSAYRDFSITNGYVIRMSYPSAFAPDFEHLYRTFAKLEHHTEEEVENLVPGWVIGKIYQKLEIFLKKFEKNGTALQLVHTFENALDTNGVHVYFQWIYDQDKNPIRYEMLSRVQQSQTEKQYNIREFISAIELTQRDDLLKKLIRHIISKASVIIRDFKDASFSINMEYDDIVDEELIVLLEELADQWFPAHQVALELIESKWGDDDIILNNLKRLKEKWYKIAMDDFWAWESSINRLMRLLEAKLLDVLKIDGWIVKRLSNGEEKSWMQGVRIKVGNIIAWVSNKNNPTDSESVIKMIVAVCRNHWVSVVAEYVENEILFKKLKKLWVNYFQWYYLSRPIPEAELLKQIDKK